MGDSEAEIHLCEAKVRSACNDPAFCPNYHSPYKLPYLWQVFLENRQWVHLSPDAQESIESVYCVHGEEVVALQVGKEERDLIKDLNRRLKKYRT